MPDIQHENWTGKAKAASVTQIRIGKSWFINMKFDVKHTVCTLHIEITHTKVLSVSKAGKLESGLVPHS